MHGFLKNKNKREEEKEKKIVDSIMSMNHGHKMLGHR